MEKQQMECHFSVQFKGCTMRYHGAFSTMLEETEKIIKLARIELTKKLKIWNEQAENIEFFEVYSFDSGKEVNVFKWEK